MKTKLFLFIILVIVAGFFLLNKEDTVVDPAMMDDTHSEVEDTTMMMKDASLGADEMMKKVDDEMMKMMMEIVYQHEGTLSDVTKGEDVRGVNTKGESSGVAKANYADEKYELFVTFENLPDPANDDFYEGWIVRKGVNFDVISTGMLEKDGDVYTNAYASGQDLTDHDFYVLTLEPNDDDPAPADHILEGTLQ